MLWREPYQKPGWGQLWRLPVRYKGNRESAMETGGKDPFLYFSWKKDRRKHSTNQSETTWGPSNDITWINFYLDCPFVFFFNLFYWSIVDLQCCANFCCTAEWFSYTCTYILFHILFPLWLTLGYRIQFPVLYSRTLLFIHSIYNSLHLLTPNSQSIPPSTLLALFNHKSVL